MEKAKFFLRFFSLDRRNKKSVSVSLLPFITVIGSRNSLFIHFSITFHSLYINNSFTCKNKVTGILKSTLYKAVSMDYHKQISINCKYTVRVFFLRVNMI